MADLASRIKELRTSEGLTQEEFGKIFGIVKSTVSLYEKGKSSPNDELKEQICDHFKISLDYLAGRSDNKTQTCESLNYNVITSHNKNGFFFFFFDEKDIFIQKLKTAIEDAGLDEDEFKATVPIGSEKAASLLSGESEPSADDLKIIAKFLNSSIDYLLGQEPRLSDLERKLLDTFSRLDDDNKDILIGEAKKLLKEQRYSSSVAADESEPKTGTYNQAK
jgi:transcriptional regulator with XRE-family HTH domain